MVPVVNAICCPVVADVAVVAVAAAAAAASISVVVDFGTFGI